MPRRPRGKMENGLPSSTSGQAVLSLDLPSIVLAEDVADILDAIVTLYNNRVWLEAVEKSPGSPLIAFEAPNTDDVLIIERASMGTPNVLQLRGKAKQIAQVAAVLAGLLGLGSLSQEIYKTHLEATKIHVETERARLERHKAQLDIKKLELEIEEETLKLERERKLDAAVAARRSADETAAKKTLQRLRGKIAGETVITWQREQ
jgi:hypothetical protein